MESNRAWNRRVGVRLLGAAALVALLIGLGMSGGFDRLKAPKIVNLWHRSASSEAVSQPVLTPQGLPDFVTL